MGDHTAPSSSTSAPTGSRLPSSGDIQLQNVHDSTQDYRSTRNGLFHAALAGNCEWVEKNILIKNPQDRSIILNSQLSSSTKQTALHIAAGANQAEFVNMLLNEENVDLTSKDINSNTAFCLAVAAGAQNIVENFLTHCRSSPDFIWTRGGNKNNVTPLYMAAKFGHGEIASKLYENATNNNIDLKAGERYGIFLNCIKNDLYSLAIKIFKSEKKVEPDRLGLVHTRDRNGETALHVLSRKCPLVFSNDQNRLIKSLICPRSSSQLHKDHPALTLGKMIWERLLELNQYNYCDIRSIINTPFNLVMEAAKLGNFDFLVMLLNCYPELIWEKDDSEKTIFHYAIINRHVKIFNLIHEIGLPKILIENYEDDKGNNLLHLAAKRPPKSRLDDVPGTALQMRQEIMWFKAVKKIVPPSLKSKRNHAKKTPKEVFAAEHTNLVSNGEKWMKEKANICLIVATIIVAGILQTAFSVPNSDVTTDPRSPSPQPSKIILSTFLSVARALAMSSSSTAIILFLSILISQFTEKQFFKSLPCKFIGGLVSLFISVIFMMVSFCITSFIGSGSLGIPIFTSSLQLLPIILFVLLVFPVLRDVFHSTFSSKYSNAGKRILYSCEKVNEPQVCLEVQYDS